MRFENSNLYSCIKYVMVFLGDNSLTGDKRLKGVVILSDDLLLDGSHIFWYNLAFSRGVVFYYHNDHLGTPQVMTDITGNIVWKADYEPSGKVNIVVEKVENNFRMPRKIYIAETGLQYNWNRYYLEKIGRFNSTDRLDFYFRNKVVIRMGALIRPENYINCFDNPLKIIERNGLSGCACTDLGGDGSNTGSETGSKDSGDAGQGDGVLCYKGLDCISDCNCD